MHGLWHLVPGSGPQSSEGSKSGLGEAGLNSGLGEAHSCEGSNSGLGEVSSSQFTIRNAFLNLSNTAEAS
jgi:hypothetical protein